ncbi:MAG: YqeG family HAD IIIA-type phosphatase [Anaerotardibacter sp.]
MGLLQPDKYVSRITQIDIKWDLLRKGLTCVFLDMDNTIVARDTHDIPRDVMLWFNKAKEAGISFCILSNNWHQSAYEWGDKLGIPVVAKACKPLVHGYALALRKMNASKQNTVMVGDQLFTDILGAKLYGISAIMVGPLSEIDLKHTLAIRQIEYAIMNKGQNKEREVFGEEESVHAINPRDF